MSRQPYLLCQQSNGSLLANPSRLWLFLPWLMRVKFSTTEYGTLDNVLWLQTTPILKETAKASRKELQGCGWLESWFWRLLTMRFPRASVFPPLKWSNNSTSLTGWLWGLNKLIHANYFMPATWWTLNRRQPYHYLHFYYTFIASSPLPSSPPPACPSHLIFSVT